MNGPLSCKAGESAPVTGLYVAVTPKGHCLDIEAWMARGWTLPKAEVAGPGVEVRWVLAEVGGQIRAVH